MRAHQNGSIKSDNVKATYDGTKWSTSDVVNYSPSYQYYAYYPYSTSGLSNLGTSSSKGSIVSSGTQPLAHRTSANGTSSANASFASNAQNASSSAIGAQASTRAVSANTSASDFFASGISAFTPATNQSTAANFNASDLQVGKATISRIDASDLTFSMERQMGMSAITLGTKSVPKEKTYYLSTDANYTWTAPDPSDMTTVTASGTSFSGNTPYNKGGTYYLIANPNKNTAITSTATDGWTLSVKPSAAGEIVSNTVQSKRTTVVVNQRVSFTMVIGDIFYSDGAVSHMDLNIDKYKSDVNPVGLVYSLTTTTKDQGYGFKHGYVVSLIRLGDGRWGNMNVTSSDYQLSNIVTISNSTSLNTRVNAFLSDMEGYSHFKSNNNSGIFQIVRNYTKSSLSTSKTSGWFIPSIGQIIEVIHNIAYPQYSLSDFPWHTNNAIDRTLCGWGIYISQIDQNIKITPTGFANAMNDYFSARNVNYSAVDINYYRCMWMSTEVNSTFAMDFIIENSGGALCFYCEYKTGNFTSRPLLAF